MYCTLYTWGTQISILKASEQRLTSGVKPYVSGLEKVTADLKSYPSSNLKFPVTSFVVPSCYALPPPQCRSLRRLSRARAPSAECASILFALTNSSCRLHGERLSCRTRSLTLK